MDWEIMDLYPRGRELEGKSRDTKLDHVPKLAQDHSLPQNQRTIYFLPCL